MRALEPTHTGYASNSTDGIRLHYEVFEPDDRDAPSTLTLLLVPAYQIATSRIWKMQAPFLSRHYRVVLYDPRGNGKSDQPDTGYGIDRVVGDALAVLDATGTDRFGLVTISAGSQTCLFLAQRAPERVAGIVIIGGYPGRDVPSEPIRDEEAERFITDYDRYVDEFFASVFNEPHSTKPRDDGWGWAHETTPDVLAAARREGWLACDARPVIDAVQCPVLVIHGTGDRRQPFERGTDLDARLPQSRMVTIDGGGHLPNVRDAVRVNLLIREHFGFPPVRERRWSHALTRPRRALFVSSPIGLGHVHRDIAIARELRRLIPDLQIDWWAQHPVTRVLEEAGERVHPLSHAMASESAHWESASSAHRLHAFQAFREMDEIFLYNFMLFHDLVGREQYDLWIGDEAWEIDYYLHENPELKSAPWVFLTDVIGFLPVRCGDDDGDAREADLCADYNAEMIEQRARYPWLRERSLYVGELDELPDDTLGPGLPSIRAWAREWFEPVGYILPELPEDFGDQRSARERLGYDMNAPLFFAAVGGTAVGRFLLENVACAVPLIRDALPDARLVLVTGPRIDPESLPDVDGLEKRPYVYNLFEHLACADAAIVQGGLTTTMELVAAQRPFVYVPLAGHWEQERFVAPRLDYYQAGIRLDAGSISPGAIARALLTAHRQPGTSRPVARDGAQRAAARIASLFTAPYGSRHTQD